MRDRLTVFFATPAPTGPRSGNRCTALRWALRLRELGHRALVRERWGGEPCDVLIALHARRSHDSIVRHAREQPSSARVVALTGTDLYGDIHEDARAKESLELASMLIVLQPQGLEQLATPHRDKAIVVRQSARAPEKPIRLGGPGDFVVVVLGHLRDVKDPLCAAEAMALLPPASRIRVFHLGAAVDESWRARAMEAARASGDRWAWLGDRPRGEALRALLGSDLLVVSSFVEGGANALVEAIACEVPIVASRIGGVTGTLGADHPGYFEAGDRRELARRLERCETDASFYASLRECSRRHQPLVDPARERAAFEQLLARLS